jgi:hypothetical protein
MLMLTIFLAAAAVSTSFTGAEARTFGYIPRAERSVHSLRDGGNGERLELVKLELIDLPQSDEYLAVIRYRCRRDALVRAWVQKVELGTGVVLEDRKIYEYTDPLSSDASSRSLACRISAANGFGESGMYSLLLEAEVDGEKPETGFVTFYWDAARGQVSMGTCGMSNSADGLVSAGR